MKHTTLQTKLLARLFLVLLCIGLLFGFSLNFYLRNLLETEVADKANLVFSNVRAMQTYVREILRPAMFDLLPHDAFVLEAMSTSYVTRKVMSDLNMAGEQFSFRRVALSPRNPKYEANALERQFIAYFQAHPESPQVTRYITSGGEEYLVMARPAVFDQSCLACHGNPEDAPRVMLERYGRERGFGRTEGEIAGLDSVIIPVEREAAAIHRISMGFILVFAGGTLIIFMVNHFFFDRILAANIGRLASLMRSRFPDEAGQTLDKSNTGSGDEIEDMQRGLEHFADHLQATRAQLSDYAANLESKVRERTALARQEAEARLSDVRLFLYVLEFFVSGADRASLLTGVLDAVRMRFGAEWASFRCFYSMNIHACPADAPDWEMTPQARDRLLDGQGIFEPGQALAPVQSPNTVRGGLRLCLPPDVTLPPKERDVFLAMGRQLGIALENLEAMESLLRQKDMLESIFEGIADPVYLIDSAGAVIHANDSGRQLLAEQPRPSPGRGLALDELGLEAATCTGETIQREIVLQSGRCYMVRAYPLCGLAGPSRAIVYARDITTERTMMASLQQGEKAMAVGLLSAGLAHEINNPLGVILCYARILWDNGQSPHAEDLDIIIRYTLQAQKVLSDLMRFASPKPETVGLIALPELVEFLARVFRAKAARAEVEIVTDIPPDLPMVPANASALEQILTNLLLNAVDALEEKAAAQPGFKGRIEIGALHDAGAGEVVLRVRDNGPGVAQENLTRLFDPFFTTKDVNKGTGLGLSVVYGLVRALGGRIEAENRDGAIFTVTLRAESETDHD